MKKEKQTKSETRTIASILKQDPPKQISVLVLRPIVHRLIIV